jgi:hypothetical protein
VFKRSNESSAVGLNTFQHKNWLIESQVVNVFNFFAFVVTIKKKLKFKIGLFVKDSTYVTTSSKSFVD